MGERGPAQGEQLGVFAVLLQLLPVAQRQRGEAGPFVWQGSSGAPRQHQQGACVTAWGPGLRVTTHSPARGDFPRHFWGETALTNQPRRLCRGTQRLCPQAGRAGLCQRPGLLLPAVPVPAGRPAIADGTDAARGARRQLGAVQPLRDTPAPGALPCSGTARLPRGCRPSGCSALLRLAGGHGRAPGSGRQPPDGGPGARSRPGRAAAAPRGRQGAAETAGGGKRPGGAGPRVPGAGPGARGAPFRLL